MDNIAKIAFVDGKYQNSIILHALDDRLRSELRKHFELAAKPVIDEMINNAMKDFEIGVQQYRNPMELYDTVHFILTDRRK